MALGRESWNIPRRNHRSEIFFPKLRNFPPATLPSHALALEPFSRCKQERKPRAVDGLRTARSFRAVSVCNAATSPVMCDLKLCFRRHGLEHQSWALWPSPCYYPNKLLNDSLGI